MLEYSLQAASATWFLGLTFVARIAFRQADEVRLLRLKPVLQRLCSRTQPVQS